MAKGTFVYKIGLVGPTRVGKTSLMAAILSEAETLLKGQPVKIEAIGATQIRVNSQQDDLRGSLMAGEFNPGAIEGGVEEFVYQLEMSVEKSRLRVEAMDYPGAWIDPTFHSQSEDRRQKYDDCLKWILDSPVLLIPVDAVVMMEAKRPPETKAVLSQHQVTMVEKIVRQWAMKRNETQTPGLLIFAPVKCESYFTDNGGRLADRSAELQETFKKYYRLVINAAEEELEPNPHLLRVEYHPIDTIGGVELRRGRWVPINDGKAHVYEPTFQVRPLASEQKDHYRPLGARSILISVTGHILQVNQRRPKGIFERFHSWLTGTDKRMAAALTKLQQEDHGPRSRMFYPASN